MSKNLNLKKPQEDFIDALPIETSYKLCLKYFLFDETKILPKITKNDKVKPFVTKFNIPRIEFASLKNCSSQLTNAPLKFISDLLNFDTIEPDVSYMNLIESLRQSNFVADDLIQQYLIPLINSILPFYFRYFFIFKYKFQQTVLLNNSNDAQAKKLVSNLEKLIWIFFSQSNLYISDTICVFDSLFNLISDNATPLLSTKSNLNFIQVTPSIISILNRYLKTTENSPEIENSSVFILISSILQTVATFKLYEDPQLRTCIFQYLDLFIQNNGNSQCLKNMNDLAFLKNVSYLLFQIQSIFLNDSEQLNETLKFSLEEPLKALLCHLPFRDCPGINNHFDENKPNSISYYTLADLFIRLFDWDIKNNSNLTEISNQSIEEIKKKVDLDDKFMIYDKKNDSKGEFSIHFFDSALPINSNGFQTAETDHKLIELNNSYKTADITTSIRTIIGNSFIQHTDFFNFFLKYLKEIEIESPLLKFSLMKMFKTSMNVDFVINHLFESQTFDYFLNNDIYYLNSFISHDEYWPIADYYIDLFLLLSTYIKLPQAPETNRVSIDQTLTKYVKDSTPVQINSFIRLLKVFFFGNEKGTPQYFFTANSNLIFQIVQYDLNLIKFLIDPDNSLIYTQVFNSHVSIVDFIKTFSVSNAALLFIFSQNTIVSYLNTLFFDVQTKEIALQIYKQALTTSKFTYSILNSLTNLIERLADDINNPKSIEIICDLIDTVASTSALDSLVQNIIMTNLFICIVRIGTFFVYHQYQLENNNEEIVSFKSYNYIQVETTVQFTEQQKQLIRHYFLCLLNLISMLSINSLQFIEYINDKHQYFYVHLIGIHKYVIIDDEVLNSLILAMIGHKVSINEDPNSKQIISPIILKLFIEFSIDNDQIYEKVLNFMLKLTNNSICNQYICYTVKSVLFFLRKLVGKDKTYQLIYNITKSFIDKKEFLELLSIFTTSTQNSNKQLAVLELFKAILTPKPQKIQSFFHISHTQHNDYFQTSEFPIAFPMLFFMSIRLSSFEGDEVLFKIIGIKDKNEVQLIVNKDEIIIRFLSTDINLSRDYRYQYQIKQFTWIKICFTLDETKFDFSIGHSHFQGVFDKLPKFSFLSNSVVYRTGNCEIDFENLYIFHNQKMLGAYSAKSTSNQFCFNSASGDFNAEFSGIPVKYSSTLENCLKFSGGSKLILPLFHFISSPNQEQQFIELLDILELYLNYHQEMCIDDQIFRVLNYLIDHLNCDGFSTGAGLKLIKFFEIVKNPQLIKQMNIYLFSDFNLLNKFPGLLTTLFGKNIENADNLNLTFFQAFVRISHLQNFDFMVAQNYLFNVALKYQSNSLIFLSYFILKNWMVSDSHLIILSFNTIFKVIKPTLYNNCLPIFTMLTKPNAVYQNWTLKILLKLIQDIPESDSNKLFKIVLQVVEENENDSGIFSEIIKLALYYSFNPYNPNINEDQFDYDTQFSDKQFLRIELLPIIASYMHLFPKKKIVSISNVIIKKAQMNIKKIISNENLSIVLLFISSFGSNKSPLIEILAQQAYENDYDTFYVILFMGASIFHWDFDTVFVSFLSHLVNLMLKDVKNLVENKSGLLLKVIFSIICSLKNQSTDQPNTEMTFSDFLNALAQDHQFTSMTLLSHLVTHDQLSQDVSDIIKKICSIIHSHLPFLLTETEYPLTMAEIYAIFLNSIKGTVLVDSFVEQTNLLKEAKNSYETVIITLLATFPDNDNLRSLFKSLNKQYKKKSKKEINLMLNEYKTEISKNQAIFIDQYESYLQTTFYMKINAFMSKTKLQINKDMEEMFNNIDIQYEEQMERMKLHNQRVVNELFESIQLDKNTGFWTSENSSHKHYKLDLTTDDIGRHVYMKTIKHFADHHEASMKRDLSSRNPSKTSSNEIEDLRLKYAKIGYIDFKLDVNEKNRPRNTNLFETSCQLIQVSKVFTGHITITRSSLLFDSTEANRFISLSKITKQRFVEFSFMNLRFVLWRRRMHLLTALEFFLKDGTSYFIQFKTQEDMKECQKQLLDLLNSEKDYTFYVQNKSAKEITQTPFFVNNFQHPWENGELSTYEYLIYLNLFAGRSFNDISQYPVFPWIIKDYTSQKIDLKNPNIYRDLTQPIGCLNEKRLEDLKLTIDTSMPYDRALFRSHYMTAAFVILYLVRCEPFTTMQIEYQSGQFDCPDRQFFSVRTMWEIVTGEKPDFRELIPEFFSLPDFLMNNEHYDFGITSKNERVDDVQLPPWSQNKSALFTCLNRLALESPYTSTYIKDWIDLIFGYKSRPKVAEKYNNLYHPYTYSETIEDPNFEKNGGVLEVAKDWAGNFGTCAEQLFSTPHPSRAFINKSYGTSLITMNMKEMKFSFKNCFAVAIQHRIKKKSEILFVQHPGVVQMIEFNNINELLNTDEQNIQCDELIKFKSSAGTATNIDASKMLRMHTAINADNSILISSAPWLDYFEVINFNPSIKTKQTMSKAQKKFNKTVQTDVNTKEDSLLKYPLFSSRPQASCITTMASDKWAVVTGFEDCSIAVWDLRNGIPKFNSDSIMNSNRNLLANNLEQNGVNGQRSRIDPILYIFGHSDSIVAVDVSIELNLIVSVDSNCLLMLSNLSNGNLVRSFMLPKRPKRVFLFNLGFIVTIYETQEVVKENYEGQNSQSDSNLGSIQSVTKTSYFTKIELRDLAGRIIAEKENSYEAQIFHKCTLGDYSEYLAVIFLTNPKTQHYNLLLFRIYDLEIVSVKSTNQRILSITFNNNINSFVLCSESSTTIFTISDE